ncbi:MAG: flagellar hook assembly protein FlgD, partial [Lachnospiraceae bacterium]
SSAASATAGGTLGKDAFLQLLVAEMQNQDPLEPSSNTDYIAQLATFSQVEELQNVSNSMQQSQAGSLIGKVVIMTTKNAAGEVGYVDGTVERVVNKDGKTFLGVDGSLYDIADLFSVIDEKYYEKYNAQEAEKL